MKKRILILSTDQFGYLTDTFKYCEHLDDTYEIDYWCWNYGLKLFTNKNVHINYISRDGNILIRNIRLLKAFNKAINKGSYNVVFCNYFKFISLIKLLNYNTKFILDIRTLGVKKQRLNRIIYNVILKIETFFFKNITVISEGVSKRIFLKKYYVLPLGADIISLSKDKEKKLNLIYVGTLYNREMIKCVKGFRKYIANLNDEQAHFTIIGDSHRGELDEIKRYIKEQKIESRITCLGRIPHHELKQYFDKANVGISFIPMTSYYNNQPPTKTFEYLLSGLPVIATKTFANEKILEYDKQSILINDDVDDFADAVCLMSKIIDTIEPEAISKRYMQHTWLNIVRNKFQPYLDEIIGVN